jgi:3-phenylpropionate/trans-cinnamate dioxygenase ferredoxin subunit
MTTTKRHTIAKAAEIPPGQRKLVTVAGREMGVFNLAGTFYALRNICPHRQAPLCQGRLRPLVISPGVYQVDSERDGEVLKCPWHQWEFDIKTGQALFDDSLRVKTYDVRQEGDEVVIYL